MVVCVSETSVVQFCSVQSLSRVGLFVTPWTTSCQAFLSITNSQSLLKLMPIELVMPSSHLILCHPLLLLPLIFPNIRVSSSESVLPIRRPNDWSFSFNLISSNECSGLSSFRMDQNRQMSATKQPWCFLHGFHDFLTAFDF